MVNIKRFWILGIALIAGVFLFAACGGSSTATSVSTPSSVPATTDTPGTTITSSESTPTEEAPEASTGGEPSDADTGTVTGYTWQLETLDTNGAKPSLAVDANGVPHIA